MPNFERNLLQTATYWAPTGQMDLFGAQSYTRTTLPCRWEDKADLVLDKTGQEITSRSRIFFAAPIELDGYLFLGESSEANPTTVANAWEVRQVTRSPDLRNMKYLTVVYV